MNTHNNLIPRLCQQAELMTHVATNKHTRYAAIDEGLQDGQNFTLSFFNSLFLFISLVLQESCLSKIGHE